MVEKSIGQTDSFQWRSREITRVEGFSDAVFAFAVTLLVVSLEVPRTFSDLMETMSGFGAFACGFALLFLVWGRHRDRLMLLVTIGGGKMADGRG